MRRILKQIKRMGNREIVLGSFFVPDFSSAAGVKESDMDYPEMNIEEFIEGCAKCFCPYCGEAIVQKQRGRKKKFCSDQCRWAFHKRKKRKVPWEVKLMEEGVDVIRHF